MKHLFVINPTAKRVKRNLDKIIKEIDSFFMDYPEIDYHIFVTEWNRDAISYIKKYIAKNRTADDITIRVHSIGGTGTLFEIVNGVAGFKNIDIAAYPYGKSNTFLRYFDTHYKTHFLPLKNQVFGKVVPMDIIKSGKRYYISYSILGLEANVNVIGHNMIERGMPTDLVYFFSGVFGIINTKTGQKYRINIDDNDIFGDYVSMLIANAPCYSTRMYPAVDAHPDDGKLDIYLFKKASKLKLLSNIYTYVYGKYQKIPHLVSHYSAKKIKISSDETFRLAVDGEISYGTSVKYEIVPKAINFVLPDEIDLSKLPKVYNNPKGGVRDD